MQDEPTYTDAKFKAVRPKGQRYRLTFDWRNFLIVGGLAAMVGLARLLGMH